MTDRANALWASIKAAAGDEEIVDQEITQDGEYGEFLTIVGITESGRRIARGMELTIPDVH